MGKNSLKRLKTEFQDEKLGCELVLGCFRVSKQALGQ